MENDSVQLEGSISTRRLLALVRRPKVRQALLHAGGEHVVLLRWIARPIQRTIRTTLGVPLVLHRARVGRFTAWGEYTPARSPSFVGGGAGDELGCGSARGGEGGSDGSDDAFHVATLGPTKWDGSNSPSYALRYAVASEGR